MEPEGRTEWVQDMWHTEGGGAPMDGSAWLEPPDRINRDGIWSGPSVNRPWLLFSYFILYESIVSMIAGLAGQNG